MKDLLVVGIMTGNSMDAVDVVLTRFAPNGVMEDLASHSLPLPKNLYDTLFDMRGFANREKGNMALLADEWRGPAPDHMDFTMAHQAYINLIAQAVQQLIAKAHDDRDLVERFGEGFDIDLVGSHGQNIAHSPPSIAGTDDPADIYSVQVGSGQALANATGIPVMYDFRSDDILNGGEGAPLAPAHQKALSVYARQQGRFPIVFCNAGNTGNVAIITEGAEDAVQVYGWDTGPFNYFPDQLVRREKNLPFDEGGQMASIGKINPDLLQLLFDSAVVDQKGKNYLLRKPPKSSDGEYYRLLPELMGEATVAGDILPFEDRLRTACYFVAYIYAYSLTLAPDDVALPHHFALCGGGWKNPVIKGDFESMLQVGGEDGKALILPAHRDLFKNLRTRIAESGAPCVFWSDEIGFDGTAMEARLFAHMAVARLMNVPFTTPAMTACLSPTVCGIYAAPDQLDGQAFQPSQALAQWMDAFNFAPEIARPPIGHDDRWSRAAK